MTPQEARLWLQLKAMRADGFHFRRQAPFLGFYLDFVCYSRRLVIEVDGGQHAEDVQADHDAMRDAMLSKRGFRTLRFWNSEINTNLDGVMQAIRTALASNFPTLAASPLVPPHKGEGGLPIRLGLRQIKGLKEEEILRLVDARSRGANTLEALAARAGLSRRTLELLAEADALRSLGMDRREGLWAVKGLAPEIGAEGEVPLLAALGAPPEGQVDLPLMPLPTHVAEDYRTAGLSLKAHPCGFYRDLLTSLGAVTAVKLRTMKNGQRVTIGGLVLIRQRPGTAKGVVFVTLEDETGAANAVVWRDVFETNRRAVMTSAFLVVHGRLQRAGDVIHVVAERFTDLTHRLADMKNADGDDPHRRPSQPAQLVRSRDFH